MSWITVIWSMIASACLTLALVHLFIWFRDRTAWANLIFAVLATSTAVLAGFELGLMRATTPRECSVLIRWGHLPASLVLFSIAGFLPVYLRAGRIWMAVAVCALRALSLVPNFLSASSLNYREILGVHQIPFLGELVSVAEGVPNRWMLLSQFALLMLIAFSAEAAWTAWHRGDRQRAVVVGGGITFFLLAATADAILVFWGFIQAPFTASPFFAGVVLAMGYELSRDMLRAAQLARNLGQSEQRLALATKAANLGIWRSDIVRDEFWATDQWRALFGFSTSERLSLETFFERLHPHDRQSMRRVLEEASAGDGIYAMECRVVLPDGQRWVACQGRVEFDVSGSPVRLHGVALDITQRKIAEQEALSTGMRWRICCAWRVWESFPRHWRTS